MDVVALEVVAVVVIVDPAIQGVILTVIMTRTEGHLRGTVVMIMLLVDAMLVAVNIMIEVMPVGVGVTTTEVVMVENVTTEGIDRHHRHTMAPLDRTMDRHPTGHVLDRLVSITTDYSSKMCVALVQSLANPISSHKNPALHQFPFLITKLAFPPVINIFHLTTG